MRAAVILALVVAGLCVCSDAYAYRSWGVAGAVKQQRRPLDSMPVATGCYSFRQLRSAYKANKAVNVVRASDSATLDIGFTPRGNPDVASLAAFLAGTTGKIVTIYDQCGAFSLTQGTDANRPTISLASLGIFPALVTTAGTMGVASASNVTPATGNGSFTAIYNRTVGTGTCQLITENGGNRIQTRSGIAGAATAGGTSGTVAIGTLDATWNSIQGVINGASSAIFGNASPVGGTATGNTTAAPATIFGAASTTCNQVEAAFWDNVALTNPQMIAITNNQRAGWGF